MKKKKKIYHFALDLKSFKLQIQKIQIIFFQNEYIKKKYRKFLFIMVFPFFSPIIKSLIYRITPRPREQEEQERKSPIFCCNL